MKAVDQYPFSASTVKNLVERVSRAKSIECKPPLPHGHAGANRYAVEDFREIRAISAAVVPYRVKRRKQIGSDRALDALRRAHQIPRNAQADVELIRRSSRLRQHICGGLLKQRRNRSLIGQERGRHALRVPGEID